MAGVGNPTEWVFNTLLGHPVAQIQKWAREGRIPANREPGTRRWRFDRDELIAWLKSEAKVNPLSDYAGSETLVAVSPSNQPRVSLPGARYRCPAIGPQAFAGSHRRDLRSHPEGG